MSKHYIAESAEPDKPRWSLSAEDYVKRAVKGRRDGARQGGEVPADEGYDALYYRLPPRTGSIQGARGRASVVLRWPDRGLTVVY